MGAENGGYMPPGVNSPQDDWQGSLGSDCYMMDADDQVDEVGENQPYAGIIDHTTKPFAGLRHDRQDPEALERALRSTD